MLTPAQQQRAGRAAFTKYIIFGLILFAILRFVSGRSDWYRAWIYCLLVIGTQMAAGTLLLKRNPELLVERSKIRQGTKSWDRWLAPLIAAVGPLALWVVAALEMRSAWPPPVPLWATVAGYAICISGMIFALWAMLTNRFFSATVRIQDDRGQTVVDSGPYRFIRHPGYTGAGVFTAASPLAMGSWAALWAAAFILAVLVLRTALEDRTLHAELPGYAEYAKRTRYRLIPFLW